MKVQGRQYRTIWLKDNDSNILQIIDQTLLPHEFAIIDLTNVEQIIIAIKTMQIRGAGLIGATAGFGMYFGALEAAQKSNFDNHLLSVGEQLCATRPTAVNLRWAVNRQLTAILGADSIESKISIALQTAKDIADEDANNCEKIGKLGCQIIENLKNQKKGATVNILTHCNAGWLAFVDFGTALSPIYRAFDNGIDLHVWVDETRPANQGSRLTAWELQQHGIPFTLIADNTGGHLMQHGLVDMVIVGADRITKVGDVANKIGTYLKALAADANKVPFYVAAPLSTFDWELTDGVKQIPIELRGEDEVRCITGKDVQSGRSSTILVSPHNTSVANYGFDVTPNRYVTAILTEYGLFPPKDISFLERKL